MVLFCLFGLIALLSIYLGSQNSRLYQSGIVDTDKRLSLKKLNGAIEKQTDAFTIKRLRSVKTVYIIYLLTFYISIVFAIYQIYLAANSKL